MYFLVEQGEKVFKTEKYQEAERIFKRIAHKADLTRLYSVGLREDNEKLLDKFTSKRIREALI